MARARNLKPGFFKNEDLAECSPWARLCFAGLWTLADREGRLEDRPKRIKGELFAYDSVEVEPLLQELARFGFIVRYEVDGARYIQVSKFTEHQTPHYTERASVIPGPGLQELGRHDATKDSKRTPGCERPSRRVRYPLNPDSPNPSTSGANAPGAPAPDGSPPPAPAPQPTASPPPAPPPSARDVVFAVGVPLLTAAGVAERNARSFLAAQSKAHGDARVAEVLQQCAEAGPVQPVPWLTKALGPATRDAAPPASFRERSEAAAKRQADAWMPTLAAARDRRADPNVIDLEAADAATPRLVAR